MYSDSVLNKLSEYIYFYISKNITSYSILKKTLSDEVDFFHADKRESFLQTDTMVLIGAFKHSQSYQNSKFTMSLQYLKKKLEMKLIFACR